MQAVYESPIGRIALTSEEGKITRLIFDPSAHADGSCEVLRDAMRWLDLYFAGRVPDYMPPMRMDGTPFQRRVMEIMCTIGYGEVMSYGEIADVIARERGMKKMSAQAVGQAVGRNPISILVPCHRVIGSHGKLGGYGGGIDRKIFLLNLEKKTKESLC